MDHTGSNFLILKKLQEITKDKKFDSSGYLAENKLVFPSEVEFFKTSYIEETTIVGCDSLECC